MSKEHPSDKPFDDTERIREDVESLLTLDLLKRGLFLPDCARRENGSANEFISWHGGTGCDQDFIINLYQYVLGRKPSEDDLQTYSLELDQPSASRQTLFDKIFSSQEARDRPKSQAQLPDC